MFSAEHFPDAAVCLRKKGKVFFMTKWCIGVIPSGHALTVGYGRRCLIGQLEIVIASDASEYVVSGWEARGDALFHAGCPLGEVVLKTSASGYGLELDVSLNAAFPFHLRHLIFRRGSGSCDWGCTPGRNLRFYHDGWTMASPAASLRYGETEFAGNPDYRRFCVSDPAAHDEVTPNRFAGEHAAVVNNAQNDESLLLGFVTSADQVSRIRCVLAPGGIAELEAKLCGDNRQVDAGETVKFETLLLSFGTDGYRLLEKFAERWGTLMHARRWPHVPNGWCSWYYYFEEVTEQDIVETVDYLAAHREEYPLEYLQIDDGYQSALGDWLTTKKEFPHGLRFLAEKIRSAGLKPGLWLGPFMVEERSELFAEHPDWMIHNRAGKVEFASVWRGCRTAVLDGTHPGVQQYFRELFATLAEFGFVYVKLDFMTHAMATPDAVYADPRATRAQALRRGLAAMREGFGEDRFILGCTMQFGPSVGLVDAERIGTDVSPYWEYEESRRFKEAPGIPNVCRNIINHRYMHRRLWINDPDVHIARRDNNRLTEDEIRLWTSALWLVGGLTLLTDRFATLDPDRAALSRLLLEKADAFDDVRPLDFFEREYPSVWSGHRDGKAVIGCFNFEDAEAVRTVSPVRAGAGSGRFRDYWTGMVFETEGDLLAVTVPPHCCRLLFEL